MDLFYTGVGSRETPTDIMDLQTLIAVKMARYGYTGRSGSAKGSDLAFESGGLQENLFRSYLPWDGFNKYTADKYHKVADQLSNYLEAERIAKEFHPLGDNLKGTYLKFHARNVYQVLGDDLQSPSSVLFCWAEPTKDGVKGGTNTAVQIAKAHKIPVYNLIFPWEKEEVMKRLHITEEDLWKKSGNLAENFLINT